MTEEQETVAAFDVIASALDEKCGELEERNVYSALMNLGLDILKDEPCPGCKRLRIKALRDELIKIEKNTPKDHLH